MRLEEEGRRMEEEEEERQRLREEQEEAERQRKLEEEEAERQRKLEEEEAEHQRIQKQKEEEEERKRKKLEEEQAERERKRLAKEEEERKRIKIEKEEEERRKAEELKQQELKQKEEKRKAEEEQLRLQKEAQDKKLREEAKRKKEKEAEEKRKKEEEERQRIQEEQDRRIAEEEERIQREMEEMEKNNEKNQDEPINNERQEENMEEPVNDNLEENIDEELDYPEDFDHANQENESKISDSNIIENVIPAQKPKETPIEDPKPPKDNPKPPKDEPKPIPSEDSNKKNADNQLEGIDPNSRLYKILSDCIAKNKNFQDPEFPAVIDTITKDKSHESYQKSFVPSKWLRPHEIFKCDYTEIKLFDTIDPNDIKQGQLGNCYFLATLSALAEFPERVKRIFTTLKTNKFGAYSVIIYINGIPTEVLVDDYFPCLEGKPLFSKPVGNELWVMLLEKAWAKLFKEYTIAEGGLPHQAMEYLMGAPSQGFSDQEKEGNKFQDPEELGNLFFECDRMGFLLSAGTKGQGEAKSDQGIVAGHAYTMMSVYDAG
jgi:hypothetical protein